jgi:hypothetical protein
MTAAPQQLPLRDIHLPDPVGWWPPAPGWWFILIVTLSILILSLWSQHLRKNEQRSLKRMAQNQMQYLRRSYDQHHDVQRLVVELSILLRRICISFYSRENAACLTGKAWLELLDRTLEGRRFSRGPGKVFADAPYRRHTQVDDQALIDLCEAWIGALPKQNYEERS